MITIIFLVINAVLCANILPPTKTLQSDHDSSIQKLNLIFKSRVKVLRLLASVDRWSHLGQYLSEEQQYVKWVLQKSHASDLSNLKAKYDATIKLLEKSKRDDGLQSMINLEIDQQIAFYSHDISKVKNNYEILKVLLGDPDIDPVDILNSAIGTKNEAFINLVFRLALQSRKMPFPLEAAVEKNYAQTLRYMLNQSPNIDSIKNGLAAAASKGNTKIVTLILEKYKSKDLIHLAITNAARNSQITLLKTIINQYKDKIDKESILGDAIEAYALNRLDVVIALLKEFPQLKSKLYSVRAQHLADTNAELEKSSQTKDNKRKQNHIGQDMAEVILENAWI